MTPVTRSFIFTAAAAVSFGAPTVASSQGATFASLTESDTESVLAAEELEARARDLSAGPRWANAARLYRNAADLRGAGDLTAAENLRLAGYISFYEGRSAPAVVILRQAADAFLAVGDVVSATATLTDAAWVAAEADETVEAHALRERALHLTRSPLLNATDRAMLVRRLGS